MAIQSPAHASWEPADRRTERPEDEPAERFANWLIVYLAAFLSSLTVGGCAWAMGLVG
jgi:hypothetical protein